MDCTFRFTCTAPKCPWSKSLLAYLAVTAAGTVVALGGLASLQDLTATHQPEYAAPAQLAGKWRYPWFIVAWELVILAIVAWVVFQGQLSSKRFACVGLLSVATILFIQFSDIFMRYNQDYVDEVQKDRIRATLAGGIITACLNAIAIVLVGWEGSATCPDKNGACPACPAKQPEVAVAVA